MKAKRVISLLLCLAMVLSFGALVSCGDNGDGDGSDSAEGFMPENLNVSVWGGFGQNYWDNWTRDYPDIVLDHSTSTDNSLSTLAAAISAGNQPDMFYTSNAAAAPLAAAVSRKLVQPLDEYFTRDKDYTLDQLPSWYKMFVTFPDENGEDHIYAIYTDVSVACLVWNKNLFEAAGLDRDTPPSTWKEMQDMSAKLTKTDGSGMVTQAGFTSYRWWFQHWRLTYGDSYQDRYTGQVNVTDDNDKFKSVMEFLLSFPQSYGGADKIAEGVSWENGNVAMAVADIGYAQNLSNDFEVGVAPMPYNDDAKYGLTETTIPGYAWQWYGIPTGAKNPDGGWLFARWAVTKGSMYIQEEDALAHPDTWSPVFLVHKPTKDALFDTYLDGAREDIKENLEKREEIFENIGIDRPASAPINADFEAQIETTCCNIIDGILSVTDGLADIQSTGELLYNMYQSDVA